jgi:hypothetical protein
MKRVFLFILLLASVLMGSITPVQAATSQSVYADSLASGWDDWSYNSITVDLGHSAHVHSGSDAVAVTYSGGWSGFQLGYLGGLDVSTYDTFRFWIHGGTAGGQTIQLQIGGIEQDLSPQANTWTRVDVPLTSLGSPRSVTTIAWFNNTGGAQPVFYLDDVSFENIGTPPPPPGTGPALSVDASAGRHAISPYIYGINYASEAIANDLRLPVRRWGGNSTTRYNWQINVHNTGNDWYFENVPDDNSPGETLPNGSASDQFVDQDQATGTDSLITIPMIGVSRSACTARRMTTIRIGTLTAATASTMARTSRAIPRPIPASPSVRPLSPPGSTTSSPAMAPPRTAACNSTTWITSRCCGTAPTATSTRIPPPTTR